MKVSMRVVLLAALLLVGLHGVSAAENRTEWLSLRESRVLVPADQPRSVSRAVEDLQKVVSDLADPSKLRDSDVNRARPTISLEINDEPGPTPEAFSIDSTRDENGAAVVTIRGTDSAGLKFGVLELISLLDVREGEARLPFPLHLARKPLFETRGMYAHLHWAYHHPYALRSWRIDDWKRYLDLLSHLGFNTIQIWPMMELLPHPLSPEDRQYLERYAEIVDYAHIERGMKVFIGSCPNNVTEDARGVPIAEREYWDFEKRLDPGDPAGLQRILDARSDLYRTIPNADGYWVIDSDPGGWKGSPPSEFVSILAGHRSLIDRYGRRPSEQPLIYWMWYSWGTGSREENWRTTLSEMKQRLSEPWRLHLCLPEHFPVCREAGVLQRAIYFPYNLVETEPSGPLTDLRFARIDEAIRTARTAGLSAIQGNAQTPLAQLPNIARLSDCAWDSRGMGEGATLQRLAGRLVSADAEVLVKAWRSLGEEKAPESLALAQELRKLARDETRRGSLGPVLGDWQSRVIEDLAYMLEIHAGALRFAQAVDRQAGRRELTLHLRRYLDAMLAWIERTGYHNDRIVTHEAYKEPVSRALAKLEHEFGQQALIDDVLVPATRPADEGRSAQLCDLILKTVLGQRK